MTCYRGVGHGRHEGREHTWTSLLQTFMARIWGQQGAAIRRRHAPHRPMSAASDGGHQRLGHIASERHETNFRRLFPSRLRYTLQGR